MTPDQTATARPPLSALLRLETVQVLTGMSRATIYRRMKAGDFPSQRRISPQLVGWLDREIADWISSRPAVHT